MKGKTSKKKTAEKRDLLLFGRIIKSGKPLPKGWNLQGRWHDLVYCAAAHLAAQLQRGDQPDLREAWNYATQMAAGTHEAPWELWVMSEIAKLLKANPDVRDLVALKDFPPADCSARD